MKQKLWTLLMINYIQFPRLPPRFLWLNYCLEEEELRQQKEDEDNIYTFPLLREINYETNLKTIKELLRFRYECS